MSRRHTMSPEARQREREANRLRMARKRQDPEYRAKVNARRRARDRERKAAEPELVKRLCQNRKRYFDSRKDDPEFWAKRKDYLRRWRHERFLDEAFEDFMKRIDADHDQPL